MVTITLPPELEEIVQKEAFQKGTTVELLTLDVLHQRFFKQSSQEAMHSGGTLADALKDYIGAVNTSQKYPEGSTLSKNTGQKFAQQMVKKHQQGKS